MKPAKENIKSSPGATVAFVLGLMVTSLYVEANTPSTLAHGYAVGVAASFALSLAIDFRRDFRNLIRTDLMAISSLYFLTLFEFLLPQTTFDTMVTLSELKPALTACLVGFAGLAIGRHFAPHATRDFQGLLRREVSPNVLISIFTVGLVGGYFHMLLAVDFDFLLMLDYFMAPRFSQPWSRGRFGDWKALLGEFGMVVYLVPPIAGIVLANRARYNSRQLAYVAVGFLFTLFYGFSSGTRNIFATYLATFLVAYVFSYDTKRKKELIAVSAITAALMLAATVVMLEFRNIGFTNYLEDYKEIREAKKETEFFVDYNLYVIAKLVDIFPQRYDYLGFQIPYLAIIRPIPRALWPGKPEGMSVSIEDAVGVEGLTLASSFVGEAYMSGGTVGVFLTGLAFGGIAGWWNRLGQNGNSPFGHLIFASGFFAAVISMRSMFVFTTAILPTIGALVLGHWLLKRYPIRRLAPPPESDGT